MYIGYLTLQIPLNYFKCDLLIRSHFFIAFITLLPRDVRIHFMIVYVPILYGNFHLLLKLTVILLDENKIMLATHERELSYLRKLWIMWYDIKTGDVCIKLYELFNAFPNTSRPTQAELTEALIPCWIITKYVLFLFRF